MITVEEATDIVLKNYLDFGNEQVALQQATGRLLAEDLVADRDFPPFTRVTMDGISINYSDFAAGKRTFPIEGIQAAGAPIQIMKQSGHCMEVMTGAMLPENTDTVIRYEDLEIKDSVAKVLIEAIKPKQNAHPQGSDRSKGALIVSKGKRISPAEIGIAATIGKTTLLVKRLPKIAIIYTGDELVEVAVRPLPHQIRTSNAYTIAAALSKWGIQADLLHIVDDMEVTKTKLNQCLEDYDTLVLSGGVSKGKFDHVPEALSQLGVQKLFHRIKQRPGKPFWFGRAPNDTIVFALPGNPVSSFMSTLRYVQPWLRKSFGLEPRASVYGILTEDFYFEPGLTYFLQVVVNYDSSGKVLATPVQGRGSGDLANLVEADAFLELPSGKDHFLRGEVYPLIFYR